MMTSSAGPVSAIIARQKAWLQPAVTATCFGRDRGVVVGGQSTGQRLTEGGDPLLIGVGCRGHTPGNGGDVVAQFPGGRIGRRRLGDVDERTVRGCLVLPVSDLGDRRVDHPMHYLPDAHWERKLPDRLGLGWPGMEEGNG